MKIVIASRWLGTLLVVSLVAGGLLGQAAAGQEGASVSEGMENGPGAIDLDRSVLAGLAKDPALTLRVSPDEPTLRLPLAPGDWSLFKGVQPYATLSPSVVKPITGAELGLAAPFHETAEDSWKGLGIGAGFQWHLSDRLDLFGEYQFMSLPGGNAPTGSPFMKRETETQGLKAGLSIHF
jgi:opacity protein-like surface antigen